MQRRLMSLALGAALAVTACAQQQPPAPPSPSAPEVTLTRLDCGTSGPPADVGRFSDVYSHQGLMLQLTFSCYLIKHGDEYMLWDTGHSLSAGAVAPKVSLVDQLARLQVKPEQIKYVGISHYHPDHTGQVGSFPATTLLIGKGDWDVLTSPKPPANAPTAPFAHFISGGGKVEPVPLDKDVFGDGTVVILRTPGHTPGHQALLVRLKEKGAVLLSGDAAHFHE
ncbi:MAG TPA: N-acyl homoserine lactonase family protein, partial [Burkholderiaceae bacterium]